MLRERFFNNVALTLGAALGGSSSDTTITLIEDPTTGARLGTIAAGQFTRATLFDPASPGVFEIVAIVSASAVGGVNTLTVIRGVEGTSVQAWVSGASIECRVTSRMLEDASGGLVRDKRRASTGPARGSNVRCFSGDETLFARGTWSLAGVPAIAESAEMQHSAMAFGVSGVVNLGVSDAFDPYVEYRAGQTVADGGVEYVRTRHQPFDSSTPPLNDTAAWKVLEPTFAGWDAEASFADPAVVFYPTEIGFLCHEKTTESDPIIDVYALDAYKSSAGMIKTGYTGITGIVFSATANKKFVIDTTTTQGVRGLGFTVATRSEGVVRGRFYWRGMFVVVNDSMTWPSSYDDRLGEPD